MACLVERVAIVIAAMTVKIAVVRRVTAVVSLIAQQIGLEEKIVERAMSVQQQDAAWTERLQRVMLIAQETVLTVRRHAAAAVTASLGGQVGSKIMRAAVKTAQTAAQTVMQRRELPRLAERALLERGLRHALQRQRLVLRPPRALNALSVPRQHPAPAALKGLLPRGPIGLLIVQPKGLNLKIHQEEGLAPSAVLNSNS